MKDRSSVRPLKCARLLLVFSLSTAPVFAVDDAPPLPSYGVDLAQTSVSGLSSGGFMTTQFHTAFSSTLWGREWWRVGFVISVMNLVIWLGVGSLWWRLVGIW